MYKTVTDKYAGAGKITNKNGVTLTGRFIIEIYSDGAREITFTPKEDLPQELLSPINQKKKDKLFSFSGTSDDKEDVRCSKLVYHGCSYSQEITMRLAAFDRIEIQKGQFVQGKKTIEYFLNNVDFQLGYKPDFKIGRTKFKILAYGKDHKEKEKILDEYGGSQTTAALITESKATHLPETDNRIRRLLMLLSFYTANYISTEMIEIVQNDSKKTIYLRDKHIPYVKGQGVLELITLTRNGALEKTFPLFEKRCSEINDLEDLIELYIESLNAVNLESKFAMIAVVFEGLKRRYVESGVVDKYEKDAQGVYIKKKGKKVEKSFKELLAEIFSKERFKYSKKDLDLLISVRNIVIHDARVKSRERKIHFTRSLKAYYRALLLFDRFMLTILKYSGDFIKKDFENGYDRKRFR